MSQSDSFAAPTTICVACPTVAPLPLALLRRIRSATQLIGSSMSRCMSFIVLRRVIISWVGVSMFTERRVPSLYASSTNWYSVPGITFMWM